MADTDKSPGEMEDHEIEAHAREKFLALYAVEPSDRELELQVEIERRRDDLASLNETLRESRERWAREGFVADHGEPPTPRELEMRLTIDRLNEQIGEDAEDADPDAALELEREPELRALMTEELGRQREMLDRIRRICANRQPRWSGEEMATEVLRIISGADSKN